MLIIVGTMFKLAGIFVKHISRKIYFNYLT